MTWPVAPDRYLAFLAVMTVLAWTPGPANLFSVATGMEKGKRAAIAGVAGMNAATLVWFGAAALGLGALVTAFPAAFDLVAVAGALYLGWLAFGAFRTAAQPARPFGHSLIRPGRSALRDGFMVQIANPKIVLFFGAVLPPFMDSSRPALPQLVLFACGTIGSDIVSMSAYGLGGAALSRKMQEPRFRRGFSLVVGLLLTAAAALVLRAHVTCGSALGRWLPGCPG